MTEQYKNGEVVYVNIRDAKMAVCGAALEHCPQLANQSPTPRQWRAMILPAWGNQDH